MITGDQCKCHELLGKNKLSTNTIPHLFPVCTDKNFITTNSMVVCMNY